jgi:hypothetical protein
MRRATREKPGTIVLSNSRSLPITAGSVVTDMPVTFPPGRARLRTSPSSTDVPGHERQPEGCGGRDVDRVGASKPETAGKIGRGSSKDRVDRRRADVASEPRPTPGVRHGGTPRAPK